MLTCGGENHHRKKILMKLAKHYFFHFWILLLMDAFLIGITTGFIDTGRAVYYILLLNVVAFVIPVQWHKVFLLFFGTQKISLVAYLFFSIPSIGLFIQASAWISVVTLYLYYLYLELNEAYFLSLFSPFDLRNNSYALNGVIEDDENTIKFNITNISARGFFCRFTEPLEGKPNLIKGRIQLLGSSFCFTGVVIINNKVGIGVKVDNSEIWDKLYSKVTKLGFLEQI